MPNYDAVRTALRPFRDMMLQAEKDIWLHPQTGFKEWFAHGYMKARFEEMGYRPTEAQGIPGMYFDIDTGRPGPTVCVMAELDSVMCPEHPDADKETGAVHACGHNCQSAALLGIAGALKNDALLASLSGKIRIMSVPAEELLELGYRSRLREEGKISYYGGKVEFMKRGCMDGVDIAFMIHTSNSARQLGMNPGGNGCIVKNIRYTGRASHAGGAPHNGINALYAAEIGMAAVNALRETFRDKDFVRFHPIITSGGAIVNAIPSLVTMESYTRAATFETILDANTRINRALTAGALALGANVEINDMPGYMPLKNDANLIALFQRVGADLFGADEVEYDPDSWDTGCTDMGDVSCVFPAIQPYAGGAQGAGHGADYFITDPERAVVGSALTQVAAICMLLENNAAEARKAVREARPRFASMADYFRAIDSLVLSGPALHYDRDGHAEAVWTRQ